MQSSILRSTGLKPFTGHVQKQRIGRPSSLRAAASRQHQQQQTSASSADLLPLTLASLAVLQQPLAAWADEAAADAPAAAAAAAEAVPNTVEAPAWLGYVLLASPIILYAIFNVYRSQVNPGAKFTDFLFIVAGVAVVSNLVSILAFHVRLF